MLKSTGYQVLDVILFALVCIVVLAILVDIVSTALFVRRARIQARRVGAATQWGAGQMFFTYWLVPKWRKARKDYGELAAALRAEQARRVVGGGRRGSKWE